MSELCFLLSCPKHQFSKYDGIEYWQLVFDNARLTKGIGKLPVSYEIHNHEIGEKAASYWETVDLSSDDAQNSVRLRMGGTIPDGVLVESPPRIIVYITLAPESFSRLLTINWKENFILLRVSLKYPATLPKKLPHGEEDVELPVKSFSIDWEEVPISPKNYLR